MGSGVGKISGNTWCKSLKRKDRRQALQKASDRISFKLCEVTSKKVLRNVK